MYTNSSSPMRATAVLAAGLVGLLTGVCFAGKNPLIVHEWGTFTALQDEQGRELTGINTDDEPVPDFVHNLNRFLLSQPVLSSVHWRYRQKSAPRVHPQITIRLETPVLYFYPPQTWAAGKTVDVSVRFNGGWLTEFYPKAEAHAPGLDDGSFDFGQLTRETVASLTWSRLNLNTSGAGPQTDEKVWLAPRKVAAATLRVPAAKLSDSSFTGAWVIFGRPYEP
jgi:hypothetical protein